jgi:hypothetical protein
MPEQRKPSRRMNLAAFSFCQLSLRSDIWYCQGLVNDSAKL